MESDLFFVCDKDLRKEAEAAIIKARTTIENWIGKNPEFGKSLEPIRVPEDAPEIIRRMAHSSAHFNVGPMASVAGAVARFVGEALDDKCSHIIIENGGDIYAKSDRPITFGVYAGENSPYRNRLRFKVESNGKSIAVCTSSGILGHSLSFGKADAFVAIAFDAETADAAATAFANKIKKPADVGKVVEEAGSSGLLLGAIALMEDKLAAWGAIEFV